MRILPLIVLSCNKNPDSFHYENQKKEIQSNDIRSKKDFFIQSAKIFCAIYSPLEKENLLKDSNYSPPPRFKSK